MWSIVSILLLARFFNVAGLPTGAAGCSGILGSVESYHVDPPPSANESVVLPYRTGRLSEYNLRVGMLKAAVGGALNDGFYLTEDGIQNLLLEQEYLLSLGRIEGSLENATKFRGFLFRLAAGAVDTTNFFTPARLYEQQSQISAVCLLKKISGITHVNNTEKSSMGATLRAFRPLTNASLQVTVVFSNRYVNDTWVSRFAWSSYTLHFLTEDEFYRTSGANDTFALLLVCLGIVSGLLAMVL